MSQAPPDSAPTRPRPAICWTGPRFLGAGGRWHEALVTTGGERPRVCWLGAPERGLEQRRLPEGSAFPAFIDSHAHLGRLGMAPDALEIATTDGEPTIVGRVTQRAADLPPGTWIRGRGWLAPVGRTPEGDNALPDRGALSEAAPKHPVCLKRADEHAVWVNDAALRLAGIDRDTPDPAGGRIVRRADGSPSGVLVDAAMAFVTDLLPTPSVADVADLVQREAERFLATGVACVHDMAVDRGLLDALQLLEREGRLPIRVRAWLRVSDPAWDDPLALPVEHDPHARLAIRGLKLFADGALGSRGARLSSPWPDGSTGVQPDSTERIEATLERARTTDHQIAIHAIGDAAVDDVVDWLCNAMPPGRRWRMEHAQILRATHLSRLAARRVGCGLQPVHCVHDLPWATRPLRDFGLLDDAYRWRSLVAAGVPVGLGTDYPIETLDVGRTLRAAVERTAFDHDDARLHGASERLTRASALHAHTTGAAWLAFDEDALGHLRTGAAVDISIWDTDLASCPAPALTDARCVATVVDGAMVFQLT